MIRVTGLSSSRARYTLAAADAPFARSRTVLRTSRRPRTLPPSCATSRRNAGGPWRLASSTGADPEHRRQRGEPRGRASRRPPGTCRPVAAADPAVERVPADPRLDQHELPSSVSCPA